MKKSLRQVTEFHARIGEQVATTPCLLQSERTIADEIAKSLRGVMDQCAQQCEHGGYLVRRLAIALEELAEWAEAHASGDLTAAADAWGDRLYVLLGDAVATGLPAEKIFREVHRSNMTKVGRGTDSFGKGRKDETFETPRLSSLLR